MPAPTFAKLEALDMQEGDATNVRRLFPRRELRT